MKYSLNTFFHNLLKGWEKKSRTQIILIICLNIIVVGFLDYLSGFEISFSLFYLFPVAIASWFLGKKISFFFSVISAMTWLVCNTLAGEKFSHYLIPYWNSLIRLGFFLIVSFLLDEVHQFLRKEEQLARTDFLTGILNRRAFYDSLENELLRCYRYHRPFSLVYIDLDGFKKINDNLGHNMGDFLLQKTAQVITSTVREVDLVARLGGDEFAILLIEADEENTKRIVPRIQKSLLAEMAENQWAVTFSIGVMIYLEFPASPDEVINLADQLMYDVKTTTKNDIKYSVFN